MLITCSKCGFSKEIPEDRIPPNDVKATCPQCHHQFLIPGKKTEAEVEPQLSNPWETGPETERTATLGTAQTRKEQDQTPITKDLPKAGFWIRVVATLVDSALAFIIEFSLAFLLIYMLNLFYGPVSTESKEMMASLAWMFSTVIGFSYYVFFTGYCGQTPGKMVLRIKVVRTTGRDIGFGKAFLREVIGKFLSAIVLCIGYLWVAFDPHKQGWHDKIARTYVIKLP